MPRQVLFLDDNPLRHSRFSAEGLFVDDICFHAYDYEQAVDLIDTHTFDVMYLDHDLSEEDQSCNPIGITYKKTGTDVVRYLVSKKDSLSKNLMVVVHTFNPAGAKIMINMLHDADIHCLYIPFGMTIERQIHEV